MDSKMLDTVGFFCGDDCYLTGIVADVTAQDFEDYKDGRKQAVKAFGRFFATWQEWVDFNNPQAKIVEILEESDRCPQCMLDGLCTPHSQELIPLRRLEKAFGMKHVSI